jgi:hypothetical protein
MEIHQVTALNEAVSGFVGTTSSNGYNKWRKIAHVVD